MAKPKCKCLDPSSRRRGFGSLQVLPSGRHRARYTVPGTTEWVNAPGTFETHGEAEAWLAKAQADLLRGSWMPPDVKLTFSQYAEAWLAQRTVQGRPLKARTRAGYRRLLDEAIGPTFGLMPIRSISPAAVREWHGRMSATHPTKRAHAYTLLKTICATAVHDDLLIANPCRIRGASRVPRASKTEPATLDELNVIIDRLPQRYRLLVILAAWCALRFGELTELRGGDIDTRAGVLRVRRGVVWPDDVKDILASVFCHCASDRDDHLIDTPKSEAGVRDVNIPPHLLPAVREHILKVGAGKDGLLFPAARSRGHLRPSSLYRVYYPAREAAGRPDLRFHDLRHTGATLAAATGATLAELMARLGHSTPGAAMVYIHAAKGRDAEIAKALSKLAGQ
jgi:integrase